MGIKLFAMDVDGVLTDGGMYYAESGDEWKKFNARDGMGIQLLREAGVKTAIITSENTEIVARRAEKLKVDFLFQGVGDKLAVMASLCERLRLSFTEVAYIGDDINDLPLLNAVDQKACPSDAVGRVLSATGIQILGEKGGEGAVRAYIDFLFKTNRIAMMGQTACLDVNAT